MDVEGRGVLIQKGSKIIVIELILRLVTAVFKVLKGPLKV